MAALGFAVGLPAVTHAQEAPASPAASAQPGEMAPGHMSSSDMPPDHHGMMAMMQGVDLTPDQHEKMKALMDQFHQAHPAGSPPDPAARKQLHEQMMAILTPAQQAQVKANMEKMKSEHPMGPGPGYPGDANPPIAPAPSPSAQPN